jgi:hypothetical protein
MDTDIPDLYQLLHVRSRVSSRPVREVPRTAVLSTPSDPAPHLPPAAHKSQPKLLMSRRPSTSATIDHTRALELTSADLLLAADAPTQLLSPVDRPLTRPITTTAVTPLPAGATNGVITRPLTVSGMEASRTRGLEGVSLDAAFVLHETAAPARVATPLLHPEHGQFLQTVLDPSTTPSRSLSGASRRRPGRRPLAAADASATATTLGMRPLTSTSHSRSASPSPTPSPSRQTRSRGSRSAGVVLATAAPAAVQSGQAMQAVRMQSDEAVARGLGNRGLTPSDLAWLAGLEAKLAEEARKEAEEVMATKEVMKAKVEVRRRVYAGLWEGL